MPRRSIGNHTGADDAELLEVRHALTDMKTPEIQGKPERDAALSPVRLLAALVEQWKMRAAKEREYARNCEDADEKYWTKQIANAWDEAAKELNAELQKAANASDQRPRP